MGRVSLDQDQPEDLSDGSALDTVLDDIETESTRLNGENFRPEGIDNRSMASAATSNSYTASAEQDETIQTSWTQVTNAEIGPITMEEGDLVEVYYMVEFIPGTSPTGLNTDQEPRFRVEADVDGGGYSAIEGSIRGCGGAASLTNADGYTEGLEPEHAYVTCMVPYEADTAGKAGDVTFQLHAIDLDPSGAGARQSKISWSLFGVHLKGAFS